MLTAVLAPGTGAGVQVFAFDQETVDCGLVTRRYLVHAPESVAQATVAPVIIGLPGKGANLTRVMFVVSVTDPAFPTDYARTVHTPLAQGYGRALGIDQSVLTSATPTTIADSVQEGADYTGSAPTVIATRQSTVLRLDAASAHGKLRVFQLDHAGHFWPTPKNNDPSSVLPLFGLRNQDMDGAVEAW